MLTVEHPADTHLTEVEIALFIFLSALLSKETAPCTELRMHAEVGKTALTTTIREQNRAIAMPAGCIYLGLTHVFVSASGAFTDGLKEGQGVWVHSTDRNLVRKGNGLPGWFRSIEGAL